MTLADRLQAQVEDVVATCKLPAEADAILDESKKDFKVTERALEDCMKDWDPQTQMTKAEWKEARRTQRVEMPEQRSTPSRY